MSSTQFDYHQAFSRNLGFFNREDQERLRKSRVAVAGLGGTGGAQVHALARLGIGAFSLADIDTFELVNFNRQIGATMETIGRPKIQVAKEIALSINPEAHVNTFDSGVTDETVDRFLEGVDVVIDSLDFYCFDGRFLLYSRARERNIWVITSPPLGFGYTMLIFDPQGMTFEDYFDFHPSMDLKELTIALVAGIAPRPLFTEYLLEGGMDVGGRRLSSVGAAPFLIAGAISAEVTNLILGRRPVAAIPTIQQFDALLHRYHTRTYRWGMKSPLQRYKKRLLRKRLSF